LISQVCSPFSLLAHYSRSSMDGIKEHKVVDVEGELLLATDPLEETHKAGMLHLPVQGDDDSS
jgi:hypothetical protein